MIPLFKVFMAEDAADLLRPVLTSGYIGQGPKVEEFEAKLQDYFRSSRLCTTNSGTSALHLALHLIRHHQEDDFSYKDEILTTPMTCFATNAPILANGFNIRWVDVNPNTGNIDLDDLERKLSYRTAAIMVVHWAGYPCDQDRISEIRKMGRELYQYEVPVIEDCAHALGAKFRGRPVGSYNGNWMAFSFQAIKHLTCGDGGVLICPGAWEYRTAKLARWYGLDRESKSDFRCSQDIHYWGYKFHMNDISATIGLANFPHLERIVDAHKDNGKFFDEALKSCDVQLLERDQRCESSHWIYTLRVQQRTKFREWMEECRVQTSLVHNRNDKHSCCRKFRSALPGTDKFCSEMISIPCGWWVTKEQREYIVDCIKKGW